jgi:Zn-dependent peptidase ImmA (M78 family)/DNA-binding XRE family transcriptional regulator
MGPEFIAANLRRLRQEHDLSQDQLAENAGISRVAYRNIETRQSMPRADTLYALAAALGVGVQDLLAPAPTLKFVRFRSLKRLNSREQVLADIAQRIEDYNGLEQILNNKSPSRLPAVASKLRGTGIERAKLAARLVRREFGLDDKEPIRDICGLLEDRGVKVLLLEVATDAFFGLSVAHEDGGPVVAVNVWERISVERRIFTAAHELGHLLQHGGAYDINKSEEVKDEEKEANVFAAYLLMPSKSFESEWDATYGVPFIDRVLKVKRMFRVSYKTVLQRLADTRPAGVNYFVRFQVEHKRRFGHTLTKADEPHRLKDGFPEPRRASEPDHLSPSDFAGDRLFALVRRGVEQKKISFERGAEILRWSVSELRAAAASWLL